MLYLLTVNYYSTPHIEKLLDSLASNSINSPQLEKAREFDLIAGVIIVNNSPDDESIYRFQNDKILIIESGDNLGFGRACNLGLEWISDRHPDSIVWLINPDAYLLENSASKVSQIFTTHPEISILGTIIFEPTGNLWFGGGQFIPQKGSILANEFLSSTAETFPTDWVSGCSMLINLKKFDRCPKFDEDYFLYYEDFDFCRRYAQQGHLIMITRQISVIHQPSSITKQQPDLKIQQSIYSYLLSLEKHTPKLVLLYRLIRISLTGLFSLSVNRRIAKNKLKGVLKYYRRIINRKP